MDASSSTNYDEFYSVLMHYYGSMTHENIMKRSRAFLYAIFAQTGRRACERLGISPDGEKQDDMLSESDYPSEFKKFSQEERDRYVEESGLTDEQFLAQFPDYEQN